MITAAAILAVALFVVAFRMAGIVPIAADVVAVSRRAAAVMADRDLDDDAKERQIRAASKGLMVSFLQICLRTAVVLAAPAVCLYAGSLAGLIDLAAVSETLLRWEFILLSTLAIVVVGIVWR